MGIGFRAEAGYIEINGLHDAKDLQPELINFMVQQWRCKEYTKYMWDPWRFFPPEKMLLKKPESNAKLVLFATPEWVAS